MHFLSGNGGGESQGLLIVWNLGNSPCYKCPLITFRDPGESYSSSEI